MEDLAQPIDDTMDNAADGGIALRIQQAMQLVDKGQLEPARMLLDAILGIVPEHVDALHLLGLVERREGKIPEAIAMFEKAVAIRDDIADLQHNLGNVYSDASRIPDAEKAYVRALELNDNAVRTRMALGALYYEAGAFTQALVYFESVIKDEHTNPDAWFSTAATCNVLGQSEQALAACKNVLKLDDTHVAAWHLLAKNQIKHAPASYKRMQELWDNGQDSLDVEKGVHLCFGLGKMFEDAGKYAVAYEWFDRGNRLKRRSFTFDVYQPEIQLDLTAKLMHENWIGARAGVGEEDDAPVFVVGMPRSGTTMIERILARHSKVHGAGELRALQRLIGVCEKKANARYPVMIQRLSDETYANLGKAYLQEIRARGGDALRVVDRMPSNALYLGLIHVALPNAKIIYCTRDVSDNAMSIFKHLFGDYMPYGYDMWEIGRTQKMQYQLMEHWKKVIPEKNLMVVRYETVVENEEEQARRMIDFLGLQWEDGVTVAPSERVYDDSSVGSARHYAKHLVALEAAWAS